MKPNPPSDRSVPPPLRVRDAAPEEMAAVLRASHAVWGTGMSPDDYLAYSNTLKASPWGRERCRIIVGIAPDDAIVSSLNLYSFTGELHGREVRIAGIGALFTMPDRRGRRFGAALVESVLARAGHDRFALSLLLSDIDASYYTRLGFSVLPGGEASCVVSLPAPWPGEPAWLGEADPPLGVPGLRVGGPDQVEALVRVREGYGAAASFRLLRDRIAWEHLFLKAGAGRRLRGDEQTLIWMIDDSAGPAAYAVLRERARALRWLEHGARSGSEHRLGDLFWAAIARARQRGLTRLEGWSLPHGAAGETLYPIARRARRRPTLMARALDPSISLSGLRSVADCRIGEFERF